MKEDHPATLSIPRSGCLELRLTEIDIQMETTSLAEQAAGDHPGNHRVRSFIQFVLIAREECIDLAYALGVRGLGLQILEFPQGPCSRFAWSDPRAVTQSRWMGYGRGQCGRFFVRHPRMAQIL